MEVILTENVPQVGFVGDLVKVKEGYFRNYLFPKKLAILANRANLKQFEHQKKLIEVKKAQKKSEAEDLKGRLEKVSLSLARTASENGKLFGSVTVSEVSDALKENGFDVDKRWIKFENPIKELGESKAEVHLHQDVVADIPLTVSKKES